MIDSVAFASCYVYSPAGDGANCARSRLLRSLLKDGDAHFMIKYAERVRRQMLAASALAGFFLSGDVLVPVPRSAPKVGGTWAAAELARALVQEGVGSATWFGLRRIFAVQKSATAAKGSRPSVATHYDSFQLEPVGLRAGQRRYHRRCDHEGADLVGRRGPHQRSAPRGAGPCIRAAADPRV